jgi:hypothetical protein
MMGREEGPGIGVIQPNPNPWFTDKSRQFGVKVYPSLSCTFVSYSYNTTSDSDVDCGLSSVDFAHPRCHSDTRGSVLPGHNL